MKSLRARVLVAASLTLLALMVLLATGLERAFRQAAQRAEEHKLRGLVYAVLGAAEVADDGSLYVPEDQLPDPRLTVPDSGLEAAIYDGQGVRLWASPSVLAPPQPFAAPAVGDWRFEADAGERRFQTRFGLRWLNDDGSEARYTVLVSEDMAGYQQSLGTFRRTLGLWLAGIIALLLIGQLLLLGWILRPLSRIERELRRVENGLADRVAGRYPAELSTLTEALNAMIRNERTQQTRYRHALDDLAHSLKTPLAVLRGLLQEPGLPEALRGQLEEPLGRIEHLTEHQLRRAATAGRRRLSEPVALPALAQRIASALARVYRDKRPAFDLAVPPDLLVRADEGDLYELLGNLLDNAAKWCRREVRLHAELRSGRLMLQVEDDGPGFAEAGEALVARGRRADSRVPGQGLGLAAVAAVVEAYEGQLAFGRSPLGGACVRAELQLG